MHEYEACGQACACDDDDLWGPASIDCACPCQDEDDDSDDDEEQS